MKQFLVFLEKKSYNSMVVEAENEQMAKAKVQQQIEKFGLDLTDWDEDEEIVTAVYDYDNEVAK